MNVDVETTCTIDRPVGEVSTYAADPDNAPAWYVNIKSVAWNTPKSLTIGSQIAFVAEFLGRSLAYTYEVMEFTPGERFVMRTAEGPFPMETTYAWEALDPTHTRMTLRNRGAPRGFGAILAPMMAMAMRGANRKDLAKLKAILENE